LAGSAESGLAFVERLVQLIRFGARRAGLVSGQQLVACQSLGLM
jgi:hypothetical protein